MNLQPKDALEQTTSAVNDAIERIGQPYFQWLAWPQTWGNSACGFGGVACQAFWEAQTVIASGATDNVLVYHRGEFAYEVAKPNGRFWQLCGQRTLPGQLECKRIGKSLEASDESA